MHTFLKTKNVKYDLTNTAKKPRLSPRIQALIRVDVVLPVTGRVIQHTGPMTDIDATNMICEYFAETWWVVPPGTLHTVTALGD
jgi:hypothetical protein